MCVYVCIYAYIACLCQSIEINNNKYVYRQSQVRKSTDSGVKWAECSLIIGMGCRVQVFLAWSSIAQSVCQRAFSLLAIWCLGPRVQILHSAEEHNLCPFDLNIACLCQSIEINNNKYMCMLKIIRGISLTKTKPLQSHINIHTHTHTHTHIYICVCVCMFIWFVMVLFFTFSDIPRIILNIHFYQWCWTENCELA